MIALIIIGWILIIIGWMLFGFCNVFVIGKMDRRDGDNLLGGYLVIPFIGGPIVFIGLLAFLGIRVVYLLGNKK